jgi:ADP-ribosylglycohydrolase
MLKEIINRWQCLAVAPHETEFEKRQCIEEGRDFSLVAEEYGALVKQDLLDPQVQAAMQVMLDKTIKLPIRKDYPYVEPSDLEGIRKARGKGPVLPAFKLTKEQLKRKLHGGWIGRCCGCLLGKPVECVMLMNQRGYLQEAGQWPLAYYFQRHTAALEKYKLSDYAMLENLRGFMPIDDDTNYTVIGLNILKNYGREFKPMDVAFYWHCNVPLLQTCTAERVAYRNFSNLILPPDSASYRNIYREAIGAQIRADFFGYVCPGNPELAADFAWRDASISHVKSGIYGEMWVAAMLAAAFVTDDILTIIEAGLAQIPEKSRFYEAIQKVLGWYRSGITLEEAQDRIHAEWDENIPYCWLHTISNAMIVATALLWGQGDYGKTVCYAVQAALDTDCNGATAGSVIGAVKGIDGIPARWSDPIKDTLQTSVAGYNTVRISSLADETLDLVEKIKTI